MSAEQFKLIVSIHKTGGDLDSIPMAELKNATALSWSSREGHLCAVFPTFPDLPQKSLEALAEIVKSPGVCVKIGQRLVNDRAKFEIAIRCYLDRLKGNGLDEQKINQCVKRWTQVWRTQHKCFLSCHVPSRPCAQSPQLVKPSKSWREIAVLNEVDWCPHLGVPSM